MSEEAPKQPFEPGLGPDPINEIKDAWNKRMKGVRIFGLIVSILMLVMGVLCLVFPLRTAYAVEVLATISLIAFGVMQIIGYFLQPCPLRSAPLLVCGLLNILLAWMLLSTQAIYLLMAFAYLFALILLLLGIEQLTFGSRMRAIGAGETGWLTANGAISWWRAVFPVPAGVVIGSARCCWARLPAGGRNTLRLSSS